ncbi:hypothetical protein M2129_002210 [Polynucleobacter sphagniphilus]|uniref:hypothetical protein n=1 Tax=Polynucleobacter sphagniphilus TaxID=1743169 RepID=UPI00247474E3|nr:hypothetical protein [Polynucleobacter sphagniphilus]MDH6250200.1 hypothetical protein [Polynucleobacter sphagniphilus]
MNPQSFMFLRKIEEMRIGEIKKRILKEKSKSVSAEKSGTESELTYERDAQEDC